MLAPWKYSTDLKKWYYRKTGKRLDLDSPQTLNEKIQWLKLNDSTSEKTQFADKFLAKKLIAEKIGPAHVIPTLRAWSNASDIDFAIFPESFVLKSSHASGWNLIVRDKGKLNLADAHAAVKKWLGRNYAFHNGFELHYFHIKPRVVLEGYLSNKKGGFIYNYQFFCFNGNVQFLRISLPDGTGKVPFAFFDSNFVQIRNLIESPLLMDLPHNLDHLEKMASFSRILGRDFYFVRIDFYEVQGNIYFGEMTFTPSSGVIKWADEKYDHSYGEMLTLPI